MNQIVLLYYLEWTRKYEVNHLEQSNQSRPVVQNDLLDSDNIKEHIRPWGKKLEHVLGQVGPN